SRMHPGATKSNRHTTASVASSDRCAPADRPQALAQRRWRLLHAVALAELLDLAGGVENVLLAGVERVCGAGHVQLDQRVLVAVFPGDGVTGFDRGTAEEGEVAADVLENNRAVGGMNVLFHGDLSV